jgi:hypothetical protein
VTRGADRDCGVVGIVCRVGREIEEAGEAADREAAKRKRMRSVPPVGEAGGVQAGSLPAQGLDAGNRTGRGGQ